MAMINTDSKGPEDLKIEEGNSIAYQQ